jgi:hypothetical protein
MATSMIELEITVTDLYQSICFSKGERPKLEKLKELFIQGGMLINNNADPPLVFTVDQFISAVEGQISKGASTEFQEKEVDQTTEVFGRIAQRFSKYESRLNISDPTPFSVGVNSIQLIKTGGKWLVTSLAWNDETPELRIAEELLQK